MVSIDRVGSIRLSRRDLLSIGAISVLLAAAAHPMAALAGTPDSKLENEARKKFEKKEQGKIPPEKEKYPPRAEQGGTPASQGEAPSAVTTIVGSLDRPMPTFSPDSLLRLAPAQITARAVQHQIGRLPNALDVRFSNYTGEPEIFQCSEPFFWDGSMWVGTKHQIPLHANWSPLISRPGLTAAHDPGGVGPSFDRFMREVFSLPTDLTGELKKAAEGILAEEAGREDGLLTGTGHCYSHAAFLALEREWNNGFYDPRLSETRFTRSQLGQLGTLYYSTRILIQDVNEGNFDPGSRQRVEARRHNVEWALQQFVQNRQPIIVEAPLDQDSRANWWRPVDAIATNYHRVSAGNFANASLPFTVDRIRQAGRPIHPQSAETRDPRVVTHKSYLTFRDRSVANQDASAVRLYPSLMENADIYRFLLWNISTPRINL